MRRLALFTFLALCSLLTGCAGDNHDSEMDQLWRAGYGYNNPNANRLRTGQAPLNFDGTPYR